ncbi:hypothetical protein GOBAR_DD20908 [Gossypium barbadense]|nr:hypothetical protein GOBAR_DD20908 [Gossypium barbadense]
MGLTPLANPVPTNHEQGSLSGLATSSLRGLRKLPRRDLILARLTRASLTGFSRELSLRTSNILARSSTDYAFFSMIITSLMAKFLVFPSGLPWHTFPIVVGMRSGNNQEVIRLVGGRPTRGTWPHYSLDQLGMLLEGRLEELTNFFYHNCGMALCPFALLEFKQKERVRGGTDLLIASTVPKVSSGARGNRGCEDSLSNSNSIFCAGKEGHFEVVCGTFNVRKVAFDVLTDVDMSNLGFDVFNPFRSAWDSFAATRKGELFMEKGEGSSTADLAPSIVGEAVTSILPLVTGGITVASPAIEDVAPTDLDKGGSDDEFLLANLDFTVGSFALTNCVKGHDSSPVNLAFIVGSFALTNCIGGRTSLLVNLDFTTESFACANCAEGHESSPTNLANCAGGRGSLPDNLDFIEDKGIPWPEERLRSREGESPRKTTLSRISGLSANQATNKSVSSCQGSEPDAPI